MPVPKRKERKVEEGSPQWLVTYGDMTTLLLTFFILMFTTAEIDGAELRMILAAFQGLGSLRGGNTLQVGKLAELGHTIMRLPSREAGKALDKARRTAISQFQPELKTKKVRIKEDERGLIISLAADSFFEAASAEINIEESRQVLQKVATLISSPDLSGRKFRIEGHTDNIPTDPGGPGKRTGSFPLTVRSMFSTTWWISEWMSASARWRDLLTPCPWPRTIPGRAERTTVAWILFCLQRDIYERFDLPGQFL